MKTWNSYGSEHSANLVMIGRFKDAASAEAAKKVIDEITKYVLDSGDTHREADRYSEGMMAILKRLKIYNLGSAELEQFAYDVSAELKGDRVVIETDEPDVSAFLKLMVDNGARVEVYSAHEYPDEQK